MLEGTALLEVAALEVDVELLPAEADDEEEEERLVAAFL